MTEAHKRANRHPKYKTAYRVKNWREYDKELRDRGDIILWLTQRDAHLLAIESEGWFGWKRTSDYDAQSHAENVFSQFKLTFGARLRAKRDASQEREASLACQLLNGMRELGHPESYAVS
jgi:hypothetical protein